MELQGKYNSAKVFTNNIDELAVGQIIELCNQEHYSDCKIRIMPDTHAGKGCTIGTTMTIHNRVSSNLVGVDIGCGMELVRLKETDVDFEAVDRIIRERVPSGFSIRNNAHRFSKEINYDNIRSKHAINIDRAKLSMGTLGGGNHFVEMNRDDEGNLYIVIHSGSRNLGKTIAEYYQKLAIDTLTNRRDETEILINQLKNEGRSNEIQAALASLKPKSIAKDFAYLEGKNFDDYLHDTFIAQEYAKFNRMAMMDEIVKGLGVNVVEQFTTIHNYIDPDRMMLRKGAISANLGEKVLIPINMRDGSILAVGKGNEDWNYSAPHGAGRLMSRSKAKSELSMDEFKDTMKDVWSTSVLESTLDESPMAYKPLEEILEHTKDTIDVISVIKPVYNFKAN